MESPIDVQLMYVVYENDRPNVPAEVASLVMGRGATGIDMKGSPTCRPGTFYAEVQWSKLYWEESTGAENVVEELEGLPAVLQVVLGSVENIKFD